MQDGRRKRKPKVCQQIDCSAISRQRITGFLWNFDTMYISMCSTTLLYIISVQLAPFGHGEWTTRQKKKLNKMLLMLLLLLLLPFQTAAIAQCLHGFLWNFDTMYISMCSTTLLYIISVQLAPFQRNTLTTRQLSYRYNDAFQHFNYSLNARNYLTNSTMLIKLWHNTHLD